MQHWSKQMLRDFILWFFARFMQCMHKTENLTVSCKWCDVFLSILSPALDQTRAQGLYGARYSWVWPIGNDRGQASPVVDDAVPICNADSTWSPVAAAWNPAVCWATWVLHPKGNVPCIALPSSGSMQQTMCVKAHSQKPDLPAESKPQKQHFPLPKHEAVHLRTWASSKSSRGTVEYTRKQAPASWTIGEYVLHLYPVGIQFIFFRISMLKCVHQGKAGLNSFGSQHEKMFCMCLQCRLLLCPYCWQGLLRHPTQTQSQWHRDCAWSSEDPNAQIKFEI